METHAQPSPSRSARRFGRWTLVGAVLSSFAAGSLLTARLVRPHEARAEGDRLFQLLVYHAVPGKVPALEARFRTATQLFARHDLDVLGYWVPVEGARFRDTFVYLVAHRDRAEAKRRWDAFHADPAFQEYVKDEAAEKLIESVDSGYMRPSDFSALH